MPESTVSGIPLASCPISANRKTLKLDRSSSKICLLGIKLSCLAGNNKERRRSEPSAPAGSAWVHDVDGQRARPDGCATASENT